MIERKNQIELEALRKQREAEAQAKALKEIAAAEAEAALKQAETLRTQAKAEVEAEKLRAEAAKARESAAGLAEADVLKAKADAAMREAEAIKAKVLAQAEAEKAKAEALAAYDGVAQRVEITKLQLDAQVQIEIAKAQALGNAMASMNLKLIGDPSAAVSLLRLVTLADGMGEVVRATPGPLREVGQQLVNKLTGDPTGDALLKIGESAESNGKNTVAELARLLPEIIRIANEKVDMDKIKGQCVGDVLTVMAGEADEKDRPTVEKARQLLALLPIINDMPFEDVYLRAVTK
jgi:hypothetical protein